MEIKSTSTLIERGLSWLAPQVVTDISDLTVVAKPMKSFRKHTYGNTTWHNDKLSATIRYSTEFNLVDIGYTLAHELIHLRQFANYKLIHCRDDLWMWDGKLFEIDVSDHDSYYSAPWEVEAREGEEHWGKILIDSDIWRVFKDDTGFIPKLM